MSSLDINDYKVTNLADSAYYVSEYLSAERERALLAGVYGAPRPKWTQLSGRRVQSWGGTPDARGMVAERLPAWLQREIERLPLPPAAPTPNHVLVNEYKPGQASAVVGVYGRAGNYELSPAGQELDQRSGGKLSRALNECGGRLELGRALCVSEPTEELATVALAGAGPRDAGYDELESLDVGRENVRVCVGAGMALLAGGGGGARSVRVDPLSAPDAAAEAAELAAWRFDEFKSPASRSPRPAVSLLDGAGGGGGGGGELWAAGAVRGRAQNWARQLADMPANRMGPVDVAQAALDVLCPLGVRVTARDRHWIAAQGMQAFLAVARGSCEPPVLLECSYDGPHAGALAPVLVAAKGVTFDSGGLCLKKPESMVENRGSMSGAAAALAALRILAELKVGGGVRMVIPLCENMVSGQCMKVGDVVHALNSLSIKIEDTDMEGRLMLSDALVYGQAVYKPAVVIDIATLTRGVLQATGGGAFGCFSNCERLWEAVRHAGATTGDRPWRFPLWRFYHQQLTNDASVDLRNKGSSKATPCLGAAFLRNFVCGKWVHMDITGVGKLGHAPAPPYLDRRRMTGRPVRTLAALLETLAPPAASAAPHDHACAPLDPTL